MYTQSPREKAHMKKNTYTYNVYQGNVPEDKQVITKLSKKISLIWNNMRVRLWLRWTYSYLLYNVWKLEDHNELVDR